MITGEVEAGVVEEGLVEGQGQRPDPIVYGMGPLGCRDITSVSSLLIQLPVAVVGPANGVSLQRVHGIGLITIHLPAEER